MDKWEEAFLREIVELDTNSDEKRNYAECAEVVARYCEEAGLEVSVHDSQHDGIKQPNIVAELDSGAENTVLLCTHYDVVPAGDEEKWTHRPFELLIKDGKAYGRGTTDDKGNIVACVSAAKELISKDSSKINWKILVSPNEEIGGEWGIDYLINGPPKIRGDFAIVVDSGPSYVSIGASGVVAGTITINGTQGHAGYPFKFNNAIHLSIPLMNELLGYIDRRRKITSKLPAPPESPYQHLWGRFSMTMYHAGSKTNVIPGKAEISFDCRLIPEEDPKDIEKDIVGFLAEASEAIFVNTDIDFKVRVHGWGSDPENPFIKTLHAAVNEAVSPEIPISADLGGNDGHYFTSVGIPTACYGTIADDSNFHGIDEWLSLDDYEKVKNTLITFSEMCEQ